FRPRAGSWTWIRTGEHRPRGRTPGSLALIRAACYHAGRMNPNSPAPSMPPVPRNPTRAVRVGRLTIGGGHPIAIQSMTATRTTDIEATVGQVLDLERAGADIVRVAVDNAKDVAALRERRARTAA